MSESICSLIWIQLNTEHLHVLHFCEKNNNPKTPGWELCLPESTYFGKVLFFNFTKSAYLMEEK